MCNLVRLFKALIVTFLFVIGTVCIIGTGGDSGGGDGDGGGGGNTSAPQTYTASGTYNFNSDTGELVLTFANTDFLGCGPSVGAEDHDVESITITTMILNQGEEREMAWTRDSGTDGDITGTWDFEEDGNTWEITFNADMTVSVIGKIITCKTTWDLTFMIDLDGLDTNFTCIPGDSEGDDTREDYIIIQQTGSTFTLAMTTFGQTLNGTISNGVYTFSGSWIESDDDGDYTMNVSGSFAVVESSGQLSGSDTVSGTNDTGNFCTWDETFIGIED
jgi:hypothetical protein